MRISDWSSDVCSSYLIPGDALERLVRETATDGLADPEPEPDDVDHDQEQGDDPQCSREDPDGLAEDAGAHDDDQQQHRGEQLGEPETGVDEVSDEATYGSLVASGKVALVPGLPRDRKSTRLNSSH